MHGRIHVTIKNAKLFCETSMIELCLRCKFLILKSANKFAKGSSDQKIHEFSNIFHFVAGLLKIIVITQLLRKNVLGYGVTVKKYSLF